MEQYRNFDEPGGANVMCTCDFAALDALKALDDQSMMTSRLRTFAGELRQSEASPLSEASSNPTASLYYRRERPLLFLGVGWRRSQRR